MVAVQSVPNDGQSVTGLSCQNEIAGVGDLTFISILGICRSTKSNRRTAAALSLTGKCRIKLGVPFGAVRLLQLMLVRNLPVAWPEKEMSDGTNSNSQRRSIDQGGFIAEFV